MSSLNRTSAAVPYSSPPDGSLDLARLEDRLLFSAGPIPIDPASINTAPVLNDLNVSLDPILEDAGAPVGAVGTLISDLVDLTPDSKAVERDDLVPFYSAGNGINSQRNIGWWWNGWDDWATKVEVALDKHGSLWMHLPYGRITPGQMDFDGRSDAAAGVPPHHGPLPHISDGLAHYLEQVVSPDDELFFYFGAPYQIYTDGMTYSQFETAVLTEFSDVLELADDAKVSIGFDNTFGRPASLGGIWSVLGGPTGYHAQLFQTVASYGVNVILEPWIYKGATWAYDYDTISLERFYRKQDLHIGDVPKNTDWEVRSLLNNTHYRLLEDADVLEHYGGSWQTAVSDVYSMDERPMGRFNNEDSLFLPAWVEYPHEVADPSTLVPLPGYNPPGSTSLQQNGFEGELDTIAPFTGDPAFEPFTGIPTGGGSEFSQTAVLDNVFDPDGLITGVAIVGADTSNGTWWYTINGGDSWDTLGTVSNSSAQLLAANPLTRIYFQPNAEYSGTIANAISFQAWDRSDAIVNGTAGVDATTGGGTSAFSTASDVASLTVTNVNDPPTINPISNQIGTEDVLLGPVALTVGDIDSPVTSLIVTATSSDQTLVPDSNLTISGTGASRSLTINPALNQFGIVTISVTVSDGNGSSVENFTATFGPDPDPPVAIDDSYTTGEDQPLVVAAIGPLANDIEPDGDPLLWTIVSGPTSGTLLSQPNGSFTYTPNLAFVGSDQFQYTTTDGTFTSNVATVQIAVQPSLAPPPPPLDSNLGQRPLVDDPQRREAAVTTPATDAGGGDAENTRLLLTTPNLPASRGARQLLLESAELAESIGETAPQADNQQPLADTNSDHAKQPVQASSSQAVNASEPTVGALDSEEMVNKPEEAAHDSETKSQNTGPVTQREDLNPEADVLRTVVETIDAGEKSSEPTEASLDNIVLIAGAAIAAGSAIWLASSGALNRLLANNSKHAR